MRRLAAATALAASVSATFLPFRAALAQPEPADAPGRPEQQQADVPVKVVVLFSSGVGYFEHFGKVAGNGTTELRFKTQQINDILKSLVLQDMDGGKVTTITYASQDPVSKTLRSFQIDITSNPSLAELLGQLRGAKLTLGVGAEKVEGTILGVEKKQKPVGEPGKGQVIDTWVLNLITGEGIRSVPLEEVGAIQLQDAELRAELEKALAALSQARDQDKKPVQIHFRGEGERRVRVGYVVETPVWKTSYRLILSEGGAAGGAAAPAPGDALRAAPAGDEGRAGPAKPRAGDPDAKDAKNVPLPGRAQLQGWAIVENQTDGDWDNVQLSLVSGRPISFIQDLYRPLYVPRPVVQPELYASLSPQTYEGGLNVAAEAAPFSAAAAAPAAPPVRDAAKQLASRVRASDERRDRASSGELEKAAQVQEQLQALDAAASVASVASAGDVGELFQYTVGSVSLPRQKSAMIPIVADGVEVEKLSIYNRAVLAKYPLNGARVRNTSGKHLLQGPVTVLDAGSYAGDARIDDVPPGQERLLSYGIDQQVRVDADSNKHEVAIMTGKIVKGVLQLTYKDVSTQEYLAQNKGDKDKTLLIEHPKRNGWKLVETPEPVETTEQLYRFRGQSPAGKQTKLVVKEENVHVEQLAILPADTNPLQVYARTGTIPQPVRDALTQAVTMKYAITDTDRQIQERQQRVNEITAEQDRMRNNIRAVQPNTDYYNRLVKKLNDQETTLETLRTQIEELTKKREAQRKELEDYLVSLNVG
jgi:hypothetical protein